MPILDVEIVGEVGPVESRGLAARIADGVARVLSAPPASVWVRLRFTPAGNYAENAAPGAGAAEKVERPVFAGIILRAWPEREAMAGQARALSIAIGAACDRPPESVHILYEPPGGGRIAFGGALID